MYVVPQSGPAPDPVIVSRQEIYDLEDVDNSVVARDCSQACGDYLTQVVPDNPVDDPGRVRGVSIRNLAGLAGAVPDSIEGATISTPGHSVSELDRTRGDFADPADPSTGSFPFQDKLVPVFFVNGNNGLGYIRPLRDDQDVNVGDYLLTPDGGSITVRLQQTGAFLRPVVHASPTSVVGAPATISFTGSTGDGASVDARRTWTWHFTGGATSDDHGPTTTATFTATGTFYAWADVADATSSGQSPHIAVSVNPLTSTSPNPRTTTPTSGSSSARSRSVTAHPSRSGSTPPGVLPGTSYGNGSSVNPIGGPIDGSGRQGGGAVSSGAAGASVGSSAGGSLGAGSGSGSSTPSRSSSAVAGGQVVGYLLAGADPTSLPSASDPASSRPAAAPAGRNGAPSPTTVGRWVFAVFGILALLVLGAGAELRRPSRGPKRRA